MGTTINDSGPRPSRREQREATVAKLIDATIEAICEVGIARASVREICQRAGLTSGAMFKQFDGREQLLAAAAEEILNRLLRQFHQALEHPAHGMNSIEAMVGFLRESMGLPLTHALRQIYITTLHDPDLRTRIAPAVDGYYSEIITHVEQTAALNQYPPHIREPLAFIALHLFSGEALTRVAYPRPDLNDRIVEVTLDMLLTYAADLNRR
ncbi:TetR/AcrR family transcriptional regulator [Nocardia brasiliensis]|uniref:TetR family transcriptional regulator n=1 Tax=Nocardia brasiliensis (strain ATCC 700358 / HUJEG-1) TaxID=1133849 RepID=K0F0K2_NOCB7|nr:TetR family transcriptional regulator [Nocardia brasiliensis]AFU02924.1 TetR family transcriptional regulator [Nocardia brasiliensis ATCC 700358]OCF85999.1 hypothetical protein AW168_33080 [Nocardia brasiliensis]